MRSLQPRLTQGPRLEIYEAVARVPGAHLRGIERLTALPLGQVLYHLDRLERMGLVVSTRDYGFRRFFVARDIDRREKKFLGALRHEAPRHVVIELLGRTGQTHKELQQALGLAGSTLSFHLSRLAESGVVSREREGGSTVYHLSDPALLHHELVYYRESFQDPLVDSFVQRSLRPSAPPVAAPEETVAS